MKATTSPLLMGEAELRANLLRLRQEQERLFAQMRHGEQHFKKLARSVWRVQEDERRRIARELHDGIGQNLTALRHRLEALAQLPEIDARIVEPLAQARALCDTALADTRTLSRLLRPQILDDLGLEPALRWLARSTQESSGCQVELSIGSMPATLDDDLSTLIFRVAQEAFNNVVKHAQARHLDLRLNERAGSLHLLIVDDGRGCDSEVALAAASQGVSTGLSSMRERVRLFGGQLHFHSRPGQGVQLRASLPLASEKAE